MSHEDIGALKAQMVLVLANIQEIKEIIAPQRTEIAELKRMLDAERFERKAEVEGLRGAFRIHKWVTRTMIGLCLAVAAGAVTINSDVGIARLLGP